MINRFCLLFVFIFLLGSFAYARGKPEDETEKKTHNNEWVLAMTEFNVSALPPGKANISNLVLRKMVDSLSAINYRTRISPEYAYYEEYAWAGERTLAARAIAQKMEERSRILFQGDPAWRYRRRIAAIDAEIETLRAALDDVERTMPFVNREPVFKLTAENMNLSFAQAPSAGSEYQFAVSQKADAFLSGSIIDFHGRYYMTVKLYTVFTRSFVWEDNIIFSNDDIDNAVEDLTRKLIIVLSGNNPAAVAIKAEPENALVLINRSFAGRGETGVLEYPPGTIIITATAPNHESLTFETELVSGEISMINLRLGAIEFGDVEITGTPESRVYHGALYIGEAPLTLRLPVYQLEFLEMETNDNKRGSVVLQTPDKAEFSQTFTIKTSIPLESGRVDRARNHYYWTWGGIWISGVTAWISYYTLSSISYAYYSSQGNNEKLLNEYDNVTRIYNGALIAVGVVSAYSIYRFIRYMYIATKGTTPAAQTGRNTGRNK